MRAKIPEDVAILLEIGRSRPCEVHYDAAETFSICWVITNGQVRRKYLWITRRPSGIYMAHGFPGGAHFSYHQDGKQHWKSGPRGTRHDLKDGPPLDQVKGAVRLPSGSGAITDEVLERWELSVYEEEPIDRIIYLDNRKLPSWLSTEVLLVEPFRYASIPLMIDYPVHFHLLTHTVPWLAILIYEPR